MLTTRFLRWSAALLFAVVFAVSSLTAAASPNPQSSPTPTAAPPTGGATIAASPTPTATASAVEPRFPPCPDPDAKPMSTAASTAESTAEATPEGTNAPTIAADFQPGYLGVRGEDVANCGTKVLEVVADSPAAKAGIAVDDVIVAVDNLPLGGVDALRGYVTTKAAETSLEIVLQRGGKEMVVKVTLGKRPTITPPTVAATATK